MCLYRSLSSRNCGALWTKTFLPVQIAAKDVQQRDIHEVSGDVIPINMVKGIGHLRDPRLNKVVVTHLYHFALYFLQQCEFI